MSPSHRDLRNAFVLLDGVVTVSHSLPQSGDGHLLRSNLLAAWVLLNPASTDTQKEEALSDAGSTMHPTNRDKLV